MTTEHPPSRESLEALRFRVAELVELMESKRDGALAASRHYPSREQWLRGEADAYEDAADELRDFLATWPK